MKHLLPTKNETMTLGNFDTLKEAQEFKKEKEREKDELENLEIDKWENDESGVNRCLGGISYERDNTHK